MDECRGDEIPRLARDDRFGACDDGGVRGMTAGCEAASRSIAGDAFDFEQPRLVENAGDHDRHGDLIGLAILVVRKFNHVRTK